MGIRNEKLFNIIQRIIKHYIGTPFTFHTFHDRTGMIITFRTTRAAGCVSVTELSPSIRLHLPIGFITTWPFPYIRQQKTEYVKKWF